MDCQTAAIILCAGIGRRIGLAEGKNKCAAAVQNTSSVQYSVSSLLEAGVDVVIVVTGYGSDSVKGALSGSVDKGAIHLVHNPWYDRHGCNYSLACGMEEASRMEVGRVVIAEGDSLLHRKSVQKLCQQNAIAASLVREKSYIDKKRSVVAVGCKNKILRYEYDPLHQGYIYIGKDEEVLGESMQLWSFSGKPLEALKEELRAYKNMADQSREPMLHSGVYSINKIKVEIEPVCSPKPEDWINLNTQQDLRKAGLAKLIRE